MRFSSELFTLFLTQIAGNTIDSKINVIETKTECCPFEIITKALERTRIIRT